MTAAPSLAGPFVAAALAAIGRRRFGAWASWLILAAFAFIVVRLDSPDVFWNKPWMMGGFDELSGVICAALAMALLLQTFGRDRPPLFVQIVAAGVTGLAVQWAFASVPPDFRYGPAIPVFFGVWLLAVAVRDVRRLLRRHENGRRGVT